MPPFTRASRDFLFSFKDEEQGEAPAVETLPLTGRLARLPAAHREAVPQAGTSSSTHCRMYAAVLFGLALIALVVPSQLSHQQANMWSILAFFLPNLGHFDAKGQWKADTWEHFKLPRCDSGPLPGAKQKVPYWVNESVWVPRQKGAHMPGKFWLFPNETNGGHWVPAHDEPDIPGHFVQGVKKHYKYVPLVRSPEQEACAQRIQSANDYHQKLILQHADFKKKNAAMEDLLQWQASHRCGAQSVNVKYQLLHGGQQVEAPDGKESGAHCQRACTEKSFAAFTWTKEGGCILQNQRSGTMWQALPQLGAYSGYRCGEEAEGSGWITDEAQKHTLLDGVSPPMSSLKGHGMSGTALCIMLIRPYSSDVELVMLQQAHRSGIFGCDQHVVYSSQALRLPSGLHTRRIYASQQVEVGGQWNTALDTDLSLAFWRAVINDPEWLQVKWIVQASPETLFNFGSLHSILQQQEVKEDPDHNPTYLTAPGATGFPAFFQVLSQTALEQFGLMSRECFWQMRYWGDTQWPQSMWMDTCLMDTVHARRPTIGNLVGNSTGQAACGNTKSVAHNPVTLAEQRSCFKSREDRSLATMPKALPKVPDAPIISAK